MKIVLIGFFTLLTTLSNAQQYVIDAHAQKRDISGSFNSIKISGGIDLYLSQSANEAVAVSAEDPKYLDNIKTVVENNVLKVSVQGDKITFKNRKWKVYVSFKTLEKLEASGASDIYVSGSIKGNNFKMDLSGASNFKGKVDLKNFYMDLSGASVVKIEGSAVKVDIRSSGASDIRGKQLVAETCDVVASGASDVEITVNKEINAQASGASNISYSGSAVTGKIHKSGASSIEKRS